ncbi:helix-turn-helix protein [Anseongella ginsenosidimutans]|uniref:Helix-turn-helix protein n=1 Tax=Anseongella ginsenosidimutans TaxID=496056 RepID=A0A4R3KQW1_9SPHI|nr:helix-turn-helix transcriptional regulator [Anseongella ginsenosidimutans]TCS87280.1 helix-turn-helix protein [Anseongella ginsenosidimutans]
MKKRYPDYITAYIKAFGQNVKKIRLEKKLTQLQLANIADVERNHIYRLEKGHHGATLTTVIAVALALGKLPRELHEFYHKLPLNKDPEIPSSKHGENETTRLVRMLVYEEGFFDDEYRKAGDVVTHFRNQDKNLNSSAVSGALRTLWLNKVLDRLPGEKKGTFKYQKKKKSSE